jgi:hypothetical protein
MPGHDRRHDDVRQKIADLAGAHRRDESPAGQICHRR